MTFDWLRHHATERNHTDAILAVTESEPQRRTLHEIASRRAWELFFAGNWSEAESLLARQRFAAYRQKRRYRSWGRIAARRIRKTAVPMASLSRHVGT